jgi:hypothetical protein
MSDMLNGGSKSRRTVLGVLVAGAACVAASCMTMEAHAGDPPTYRTIAPMDARPKRGETRYRAQVHQMPAQPYAWGWFGAKPRSQPSWQRGYYGNVQFWSRGH